LSNRSHIETIEKEYIVSFLSREIYVNNIILIKRKEKERSFVHRTKIVEKIYDKREEKEIVNDVIAVICAT